MRILFVQPLYPPISKPFQRIAFKLGTSPAITLQQLATITPPHHSIELINEPFQRLDFSQQYDVVAISCITPTAPRAYNIADEFRRKGNTVVLGGYHPSALPQEALSHADSVVIGEAENVWATVLRDIEQKNLQPMYYSKTPADLKTMPPLRQGVGEFALLTARIEATRGCPMRCDYCSMSNLQIHWHVYRKKPVPLVVKELQMIPQKWINFCDASLTIDIEYSKSLFKAMKSLNKRFICYANIHMVAKDEDFLNLAKEAGCTMFNIGFDSLNQASMNAVGKAVNQVNEYKTSIKKVHDHGLAVNGQFVFGFDNDTTQVFQTATQTINNLDIDSPSVNILVPYPGTALYYRLDREGRILTKEWDQYTLDKVVFQPKKMSPDDLLDGAHQVWKTLNSTSNILKRCLKAIKLGISPTLMTIGQNLYGKALY
jgi:radical SAM superfamily enzyme YgiQ (UPF0313 family)